MNLTKRARYALLALVALTAFILLTVQGPVLTDGVAYYAPIMICAFLVWRFFLYSKNRSHSYTFVAGIAGGLLGTLIWPTGILVALMITGNAADIPMPLVMLFASFFVASILGGTVSMLISAGFDRHLNSNDIEPIQIEPPADNFAAPKAV